MQDSDPGDVVARATGAPINPESASGLAAVRQAAALTPLPVQASMPWLSSVVRPLPGEVHVLLGDLAVSQMLATQLALALGRSDRRTLAFLLSGRVETLINRARGLTSAWPAADASTAAANVSGYDGASSLRELTNLIDSAVDFRRGTHRDCDLVVIDHLGNAPRRLQSEGRWQDQLVRCLAACRENGKAVLVLAAGPETAHMALSAEADALWQVGPHGNRYQLTVRSGRGGGGHGLLLEQDAVTGELRPAPIVDPFPARARIWAGGENPIVDIEAVLRPAEGLRPRYVGHGLSDRRVELMVSLLERVSVLELKRSAWDAEVLLSGDGPFAGFMGLALGVSLAASLLNRPVPADCLVCGEVGLDRKVRPLSSTVMETLTFAAAAGRLIRPSSKLLVAPRTASALDGIGCQAVPIPTLDAALLHLWPELH